MTSSATSRSWALSAMSSPWTPTPSCPATPPVCLVGNMAHPLNRPVYDSAHGRVVRATPSCSPERPSASPAPAVPASRASLRARPASTRIRVRYRTSTRISSAKARSWARASTTCEAFSRAVAGRFPENLILSHDLLEGCYARSALVTDVDLIEEHPISYTMDASRRHRWTRGDWQLAGWLLPRVPGPARKATTQSTLACSRSGSCSTICAAACCRPRFLRCGWEDGSGSTATSGCGRCLVAGAFFGPVIDRGTDRPGAKAG